MAFCQCLGTLRSLPRVKWPHVFTRFIEAVDFLNFELFSVTPPENHVWGCATDHRKTGLVSLPWMRFSSLWMSSSQSVRMCVTFGSFFRTVACWALAVDSCASAALSWFARADF